VKKCLPNCTSPTTVAEFFYVGSEIISEKTGTAWKDYIFFAGQRIAEQTGATEATVTYLHTDHLGSTRACTDANGNANGTCDYEPYGEVQPGASCSVPTKFRFAGMQWDEEAQLYHTWFRKYDPNQGRWMSTDPLPGSPGDPQSLNRYAYVRNDPVNFRDPYGLECFGYHVWFVHLEFEGEGEEAIVVQEHWVYGGFIVSYCTGGQSGGNESGGGGGSPQTQTKRPSQTRQRQPRVDQDILKNCVERLFGVTMTSFTPSQRGTHGTFTGFGPDSIRNNGNNARITVTNDRTSYTSADLNSQYAATGGRLPRGGTLAGLTWPPNHPNRPARDNSPYINYTANNLSPMLTLQNQIHELGHSLRMITSGRFQEAWEAGNALVDCVRNGGGFRWR
jgi:RHS repeat-associated protein